MSETGMEAVLNTPELLESILLHVDIETLLVSALRVSKTWHAVIEASVRLQQALFFTSVSGPAAATMTSTTPPYSWEEEAYLWKEDESSDESDGEEIVWDELDFQNAKKSRQNKNLQWPTFNPLLQRQFGSCFFDLSDGGYGYSRRCKSFYHMPWTPRAREVSRKGEHDEEIALAESPPPMLLDPNDAEEEEELRRRFTRRGASWRRMLVCQPPPPALGYHRIFEYPEVDPRDHGMSVSTAVLHSGDGGLRMGQLYDLVQYHAGHHEFFSLWFRVIWVRSRPHYVTFHSRNVCRELLEKTKVVVEFYDRNDQHLSDDHFSEPPDVQIFDAHFRCDNYQHADFQTVNVTSEYRHGGLCGLPTAACVF